VSACVPSGNGRIALDAEPLDHMDATAGTDASLADAHAARDAEALDAESLDAHPASDAQTLDAESLDGRAAADAEALDAVSLDAHAPDAMAPPDASPSDSSVLDARAPDAATAPDAQIFDASNVDSGPCSCLARDCGDDGCGGSCGGCSSSATCDPAIGLCVLNTTPAGVTVTWHPPCWELYMLPGDTQMRRYQAMAFDLQTSAPIPLNGTLYYNDNCDPRDGTDNLNDTGGTTGSGSWLFFFIHHPDQRPTSAVWWLGHSSSGCVDYTNAPDCQ
jgi:hypothetical protein